MNSISVNVLFVNFKHADAFNDSITGSTSETAVSLMFN